ncbi:uracil phosphoribosyltransferase [Arcicella aurantiaca]|uniref:Uracil phosphoribosyltransferase n=1 Tax=Arcicella aurantiaca TaxID=591202 RepID=A0A316EF03_9BACT|nr:uracil phosphoribosyltransferase [Arcicella aurantiaca]PWK27274.1 uracil phosphoribosyltransferase [Arcicella aurantiaca]
MFVLTETNSIANHFIAELRDVTIQNDSMRFRKNMERLGEVLAYEISKSLPYQSATIQTPLALAHTYLLSQQPVLVTILRASLPFHQGFLNVFDKAENAFIGAYRGKHRADETFDIQMDYLACPDLNDKIIIMIDPMLATGKSLLKSYEALLAHGKPARTIIVSAIAAPEGIAFLQENLPDAELFLGTIDEKLNNKFYIVPGLGDAGDLAYGEKL